MNINDTSRKIHAKIRQICEIPNIFLLKNSNLLLEKLGCGLLTAFFQEAGMRWPCVLVCFEKE